MVNGSTLTLGVVAGLAVAGAVRRRGSRGFSDHLPKPESAARAATVAAEQARLDAEVDARQAKLDAARRKPITDDPDWDEWLAHLAQRVEEAKARADGYRAMQREYTAREAASALDQSFARQSAEALVAAIRAAGGPSQLRVWSKPGTGVRVYFPAEIGYLDVGQDGSVSETNRGKLHFNESGLYPAWKRAVREGRRAYLAQLGERLAAHGEARAARVAGVRKGSAMLWTPAELDSQIAQLQRGIARRKREIASLEPRASWGPGYARELAEKREALAYHERELETIRAQRAEWGKGSAARAASDMGRYRFVTNCIGSTYEDISALKETATGVSRATFARAIGPEEWKWIQKELGYDRDFRISGDWHVGYDTGTYRGVPAYWLTHSGIEWIFTLDGEQGKSRARRGSRALDFDFFEDDEPEPEASPQARARRAFEAAAGTMAESIDANDLFREWPEGVDERVQIVQRHVRDATPGWFVYAPEARTEADARRVGARVHKALVAPRNLRADQIRLHELPLTVGWSGGTVGVGTAR